jgi:hypothetical protein
MNMGIFQCQEFKIFSCFFAETPFRIHQAYDTEIFAGIFAHGENMGKIPKIN